MDPSVGRESLVRLSVLVADGAAKDIIITSTDKRLVNREVMQIFLFQYLGA
jgi:hypothetical protein